MAITQLQDQWEREHAQRIQEWDIQNAATAILQEVQEVHEEQQQLPNELQPEQTTVAEQPHEQLALPPSSPGNREETQRFYSPNLPDLSDIIEMPPPLPPPTDSSPCRKGKGPMNKRRKRRHTDTSGDTTMSVTDNQSTSDFTSDSSLTTSSPKV